MEWSTRASWCCARLPRLPDEFWPTRDVCLQGKEIETHHMHMDLTQASSWIDDGRYYIFGSEGRPFWGEGSMLNMVACLVA